MVEKAGFEPGQEPEYDASIKKSQARKHKHGRFGFTNTGQTLKSTGVVNNRNRICRYDDIHLKYVD